MRDDPTCRFIGENVFLRLWPFCMVLFGVYLATHHGIGIGALFALCGCVTASVLPWRFSVFDDGLYLQFAFGKHRFLPRTAVTVRVDRGGGRRPVRWSAVRLSVERPVRGAATGDPPRRPRRAWLPPGLNAVLRNIYVICT